jgi:hypothetical protein
MKKINYIVLVLLCYTGVSTAKPVALNSAQTVATNFCKQNAKSSNLILSLFYTGLSRDGQADYYVFNINSNSGFVIVSAEDAAHPILGYSYYGAYVIPKNNNNVDWWMNCRKQEIEMARTNGLIATSDIANEWIVYSNNTILKSSHRFIESVLPLVKSTWDQPNPYDAMCPGGSVTGCVATCMAQIMRYWQYPPSGQGSTGYWDEQAYGYQNSFGYLSADFDTSNYNWSGMPLSVTSANNEVAKLMYDCGISVCMDYSPSESGAWVITGDYPVCAQTAFVKYFGYNPETIQGLYQSDYTTSDWENLIENELNNSRPVEYVGWDSVQNAGHTWVCDGDSNTHYHMNWGGSGRDVG